MIRVPTRAVWLVSIAAISLAAGCSAARPAHVALPNDDDDIPGTGTFSIIAYDSASGQIGGAVQSTS